jgi:hypothetical protein
MTMLSVAGQCLFYVCTFLLGILGGLCFEFYQRLRRRGKIRGKTGAFWDLVFWLIMLAVVYGYLLLTVRGEFRLSVAVVLFLGAFTLRRIKN